MTLSQVQAAYQDLFNEPVPEVAFHFSWIGFGMGTCVLMLVLYFALRSAGFYSTYAGSFLTFLKTGLGSVGIAAAVTALVGAFIYTSDYSSEKKAFEKTIHQSIDAWKITYALPYFKTLPHEKQTLVDFKVDDQALAAQKKAKDSEANPPIEQLTPVTLSFRIGERIITRQEQVAIFTDLEDGADGYVTYMTILQPIGTMTTEQQQRYRDFLGSDSDVLKPQYPVGTQNYSIHVPENYEFQDFIRRSMSAKYGTPCCRSDCRICHNSCRPYADDDLTRSTDQLTMSTNPKSG